MERASEEEEALERQRLSCFSIFFFFLLLQLHSSLTLSLAPVIFWLEVILLGKTEDTVLAWGGPSSSQRYSLPPESR